MAEDDVEVCGTAGELAVDADDAAAEAGAAAAAKAAGPAAGNNGCRSCGDDAWHRAVAGGVSRGVAAPGDWGAAVRGGVAERTCTGAPPGAAAPVASGNGRSPIPPTTASGAAGAASGSLGASPAAAASGLSGDDAGTDAGARAGSGGRCGAAEWTAALTSKAVATLRLE
jgi:hypothetical protein